VPQLGEREQGADYVGEVLDLMADDPYEDEAVIEARTPLRDAYLEAAGEEWVQLDPCGHGDDDEPATEPAAAAAAKKDNGDLE
jgi:hypothetical protein